ncbi:hypothetical protein Tco_1114678 [Tanacetum coccineum]|uniref:Uncharacterized protein n=1 Tax=Tanacetum coccineum TaxID=301880 RepID=A0ABQ5IXB8_9ASTR
MHRTKEPSQADLDLDIGNEARRWKMAAWSKSVVCTRVIVLDKLIQRAASQLSDELPESREAACALLLFLESVSVGIRLPVSVVRLSVSVGINA